MPMMYTGSQAAATTSFRPSLGRSASKAMQTPMIT